MIQFTGVSKKYGGVTVIENLDLEIAKGEFCVLIGASGSGKSTILKMINRLEEHDTGEIRFAGEEIRSFQPETVRRQMGYVIQSVGLFPHWTIADNIATVPRLLAWDKVRVDARVSELLKLLGLDQARIRTAYPHMLSGGQQQRVGVARALAADPDVLLMDEPFGALDPIVREGLQAEVSRIHRTTNKTIVFVTHDIDEALKLATRIVIIDAGKIVQAGSPRTILNDPANAFVRDFLGREDYGLKLLSVERVVDHMRAGETSPDHAVIGIDDNLRSALSRLVALKSSQLSVVDADGRAVGILHLSDITS
jgi:osmoprotectant transport system ATP-binding protein